jgi:hypothetical protein
MASLANLATIASDPNFQLACGMALETAAINVLAEDPTTSNHALRSRYAIQVVGGSANLRGVALAVLTNATIAAEANVSEPTQQYAIPDSDIQFAINSIFNDLAGIST